jgi:hypothetical protein
VSREAWSAEWTVHVAPFISRSLDEISLAESLLGRDDALVKVLDRQAVAMAQLSAVIAVLVVSVVGVVADEPGALPLVIASAVGAIGFGCRAAMRTSYRRERVRDLIISGRGDVPLAVVQRECGLLLDACRRETLAHCYESLGDEPSASGRVACRASVIVAPILVAKVRPELALIAALLRDDAPAVRGVAAAQRLICAGTSSLFGDDHEVLRQDLHRVAYLLRG